MSKFRLSVFTLTLAAAGVSPWLSAAEAQAQLQQQNSAQNSTADAAQTTTADTAATAKKEKKEQIEVIEVRSFAGSLIQSLNVKRFNDTVSETISADDLGALPDVSMADALTRLPGVSAVRTGG